MLCYSPGFLPRTDGKDTKNVWNDKRICSFFSVSSFGGEIFLVNYEIKGKPSKSHLFYVFIWNILKKIVSLHTPTGVGTGGLATTLYF